MQFKRLLWTAGLLRLVLVVYGLWQDSCFDVKYTDIDYYVYTDAATLVFHGQSPYHRLTYRYSPLIAWMLIPNILYPLWGKILFCWMDLVSAWLIHVLVRSNHQQSSNFAVALWLFNPFTFTISTRGSCDSVTAVTLLSLIILTKKKSHFLAGIVWGLSIHWRLFPVIYAPALLLYILHHNHRTVSIWSLFIRLFSLEVLKFGLGVTISLFSLGGLFFGFYGYEYLENCFLYHISRSDPRHNFSIHFYSIYLLNWKDANQLLSISELVDLGKTGFLAQGTMIVFLALRFHQDLTLSFLLTTLIFVAFNKVCTAQYFVWYFCLLPILLPRKSMELTLPLVFAGVWWIIGQVNWLFWAYLLEFQGKSVYLQVWISSCIFLVTNTNLLVNLILVYGNSIKTASR